VKFATQLWTVWFSVQLVVVTIITFVMGEEKVGIWSYIGLGLAGLLALLNMYLDHRTALLKAKVMTAVQKSAEKADRGGE
jgi:hypothetical protein